MFLNSNWTSVVGIFWLKIWFINKQLINNKLVIILICLIIGFMVKFSDILIDNFLCYFICLYETPISQLDCMILFSLIKPICVFINSINNLKTIVNSWKYNFWLDVRIGTNHWFKFTRLTLLYINNKILIFSVLL